MQEAGWPPQYALWQTQYKTIEPTQHHYMIVGASQSRACHRAKRLARSNALGLVTPLALHDGNGALALR